MLRDINFANPEFLYLLLGLIPLIAWYIYRLKKSHSTLQVSNIRSLEGLKPTWKMYLRHVPFVLRLFIVALIVIVMARPQSMDQWEEVTTEGIDILIALDVSTSMLAQDFKPNRLEAAKDVAIEFISGRPDDRMGLVIFSGESFTQCPLTTDHAALINLFRDISTGLLEDGTAIGDGLATSVKRLKDSEVESKVIILLTDGENNKGMIDPETAAGIAESFGIKVYTIGVGSNNMVPYPFKDPFGRTVLRNVKMPLDEDLLRNIADKTGGSFFRAENKSSLMQIYNQIDELEKAEIDVKQHRKVNEEYLKFAFAALMLFLIEFFVRKIVLRSVN
jgi:Ca-activated chloride channel family protein